MLRSCPFLRRSALSPVLAVLALWLAVSAAPALAASICGTVTDADTGLPVARAGVVLRTDAGAYTGDHTATDADGRYCLSGLLPGTYTLEVRVDDYVVFYGTGIEVADDVSDVPVAAHLPAVRLAAPWPNPASGPAKLRVIVARPAPVRLSVYDARGRLTRRLVDESQGAGWQRVAWDGRDDAGHAVANGAYFARLAVDGPSGEEVFTRRVVLLR